MAHGKHDHHDQRGNKRQGGGNQQPTGCPAPPSRAARSGPAFASDPVRARYHARSDNVRHVTNRMTGPLRRPLARARPEIPGVACTLMSLVHPASIPASRPARASRRHHVLVVILHGRSPSLSPPHRPVGGATIGMFALDVRGTCPSGPGDPGTGHRTSKRIGKGPLTLPIARSCAFLNFRRGTGMPAPTTREPRIITASHSHRDQREQRRREEVIRVPAAHRPRHGRPVPTV